jgi:hypothetical protein
MTALTGVNTVDSTITTPQKRLFLLRHHISNENIAPMLTDTQELDNAFDIIRRFTEK